MKSELPSKQAIEKELDELESVLVGGPAAAKGESPSVVLCHGDLCPANITFDPLRRSATFATPEYAGANYQVRLDSSHSTQFRVTYYQTCNSLYRRARGMLPFLPALNAHRGDSGVTKQETVLMHSQQCKLRVNRESL